MKLNFAPENNSYVQFCCSIKFQFYDYSHAVMDLSARLETF